MNTSPFKQSKLSQNRAQGMVEFALALPVVLLLMLGIIEFGRMLVTYSAVYTASREAVRYGTANGVAGSGRFYYQDCAGMRATAVRVGAQGGVQENQVEIRYDHGPTDPPTPYASLPVCNEGPGSPYPLETDVNLGDRVIVRVTTLYKPIVPLVNIPAFPVSSTTARTIIRDVDVMGTPLPSPTLRFTYTPTVPPTPTLTPTLTPSFTPTISPTLTLTETAGPSPTPTRTATATLTRTVTATQTVTATGTVTPTRTVTATPTPTATPRVDCSKIEIKEPVAGNRLPDDKFIVDIRNKLLEPLVIQSISVSWDGGSQVTAILLDNDTVWTGSAPSPRMWAPEVEYTVPAGVTGWGVRTLAFSFSWNITTQPIIAVQYDNGCISAFLP